VDRSAEDGADVPEDADGTRRFSFAGVDMPEPMERDRSGMEPAELLLLLREVSGRELRAADMAGHWGCGCVYRFWGHLATVERDGALILTRCM
jgi:hypothetical protein